MPTPLTELEEHVYHFLIDFLAENTYQPSIREIARQFRIKSTKTVSDLLHALEHKGYIERDESRSRGVRLLGLAAAGATQPVPCYRRVRAGAPAVHPDDREHFITIDRRFVPAKDVFFVRAAGGLSDRGILDGDYVMISPAASAADGDVVCQRDGEQARLATLAPHMVSGASDTPHAGRAARADRIDDSWLGVVVAVFRPLSDRGVTGLPDAPRRIPAS